MLWKLEKNFLLKNCNKIGIFSLIFHQKNFIKKGEKKIFLIKKIEKSEGIT